MKSPQYDLIVLGAGPGGYVAAIRAAQLGLRTALVERDHLGGVCLNQGCIPSKALISFAEAVSLVRHADQFGITVEGVRIDFQKAVAHSRQTISRLRKGIEALLKKHQVALHLGTGCLVSRDQVRIQGPEGEIQIQGENIIIACGTRVKSPPGVQVDGQRVLTSQEALFPESLPRSMTILGAGYTGVEFAYVFSAYGVEVTLVESLPQILPTEDAEAVAVIARRFQRNGIRLLTHTRMEKIRVRDHGVQVVLDTSGRRHEIQSESVLIAMGRQTNIEGLGLEKIGITCQDGFIQTNGSLQTTVPNIFAIGDVAGKALLAHSAMAEGIFVAENLAGQKPVPIDYHQIPRCVYCQPQLAAIGMTEEQARRDHAVRVGKFPFSANGKALGSQAGEGFVKVITEEKTHKILGVHMVGREVTELISEVSLACRMGASARDLSRAIHPHPTLSEALMEAAAAAADEAIHL